MVSLQISGSILDFGSAVILYLLLNQISVRKL
jgi:hypothetical protein